MGQEITALNSPVAPDTERKEISKDTADRLWAWSLHEDTLLHTRSAFFLLAETVLLTAFASIISVAPHPRAFELLLEVVGLIVSALWWIISSHQISGTMGPIKKAIRESDIRESDIDENVEFYKMYKKIDEERSQFSANKFPKSLKALPEWLRASAVVGKAIALIFLIVWLVLLIRTVVKYYR
jgi:hypothetical protein